MTYIQTTFLFIITILLLGCSVPDTAVQSNSSKTYNKPIKKIYTIVEKTGRLDSLNYDVCLHLKDYFKDKGITPKFYTRHPLSLDADHGDKEIQEEIDTFSPDVVMSIDIISVKENNNNDDLIIPTSPISNFLIEIKIREPNKEDLIWRAALGLHGSYYRTKKRRKNIAKAIIKKWESDGLIK